MTDLASRLKAAAELEPLRKAWSQEADVYSIGAADENARLRPLLDAMAEVIAMQDEANKRIHHALANAQEWDMSDPEDSELDRDQQVSNWLEKAFDELEQTQAAARERLKFWTEEK